jgi:hypothetical protein
MMLQLLTINEYLDISSSLDYSRADIFYLPEYLKVSQFIEPHPIRVAVWRSNQSVIIYPYLLRSIPNQLLADLNIKDMLYDTHSVFEFGGPLCINGESTLKEWEQFNLSWIEYCQSQKIITDTVDLHPFLDSVPNCLFQTFQKNAATAYVNFSEETREVYDIFTPNARRNIKLAQKAFITVSETSNSEFIQGFVKLYYETMRRVGASKYYYFPYIYFEQLLQSMHDKAKLFVAVDIAGEMVGGLILLLHSKFAHYFLGGWNIEFSKQRVNYLLMFSAIQWAKNHGFQIFHLGSGQRSLLDYKMKFANRKRDLNIGFNIYNPGLYSKLLSTIPEDKKMI